MISTNVETSLSTEAGSVVEPGKLDAVATTLSRCTGGHVVAVELLGQLSHFHYAHQSRSKAQAITFGKVSCLGNQRLFQPRAYPALFDLLDEAFKDAYEGVGGLGRALDAGLS